TYVNHLPMEDYLAGVIGCEMSLSWPDSALETQAICARTYALHEMTASKHKDFDVYDSVKSQVYRGIANDDDRARAMIAKTRGLVLTYQGRVFPTFFSSTCGGHTASAELAFGGPKIPPLSGRPCEACKISKYYRWSRNLDKSTIEKKLRAAGATIPGPLSSIQIVQAGPSGHARTVELKGASGSTTWPATRFRMAVGPGTQGILSTRFQTLDRGDTIDFEGGGWGHGVGLCQMGTLGLARDGVPCDRICRFYYPGALIRRFW
ncbi:MAG: SpoIID/LytB domain-containing protein, partial [Planctomycetota bacterium]|nr:SpoIID/LytB domain-containing protein [Planctomycetota bacterium]